ncbi:MAG TPA: hypothetical protein VK059_08280 [Nocardioidaceae bacterium]|nr:hypothetical protein [Nocardioidaceae bacterium]
MTKTSCARTSATGTPSYASADKGEAVPASLDARFAYYLELFM